MLFSLLQTLRTIPLAFLDVETTGASADFGHRVIELGIVRMEGGRVVAEYQQLMDPQRRISAGVTALTGISQSMVDGQPTFTDQLPAAMELLRGAAVLGHNVRFDLSFLRKEFRRSKQDITVALGEVPVMDTVRIARKRFGRGGNGLQQLAPRLGVFPSVAHRALADAQTTAGVFEKLMDGVSGWETCLCDALSAQGGPMGLLPINPRESLLPLELEEALEQRVPVIMEYLDANQQRTQRMIEPLHIRRAGGELMLIAHCHLRNDRRTFKLERIVQLTRAAHGERSASAGEAETTPLVPAPPAAIAGDPLVIVGVAAPDAPCEAPAEPSPPPVFDAPSPAAPQPEAPLVIETLTLFPEPVEEAVTVEAASVADVACPPMS